MAACEYGYKLSAPADRSMFWNIGGAVGLMALLWAQARHWRGPVLVVATWWAAEKLLTVGCNAAYIIRPWVVQEGADMCSSLIDLDLGKIGAAVLLALAVWLSWGKPD